MKYLLLGSLSFLLVCCSSKVSTNLTKSYAPLDYKDEVIVIGLNEDAPEGAVEIGTVKIGDTGFSSNCGWDVVVYKAKMEARKAGGNVLMITKHIPPSVFGSSCDRITAKILKVENASALVQFQENSNQIVDSTWNYAKLFVYRPSGMGALVGYDLYLGDSVICRVKNNTRFEIKVSKKGMNSLWAKTESKTEIPVTIEYGREYYLRCAVGMGAFVGRPQLQLMGSKQGKAEYFSMENK